MSETLDGDDVKDYSILSRSTSKMGTVEALKDGQIYRWRWSDAKRDADNAPYRSYHCKSQIAVVHRGLLIDTFWFGLSSDYAIRPEDVTLEPLCDTSWPTIAAWQIPYYSADDIADTRHSNNSGAPIYLRPGAKKNAARLLEEIEHREERARSEIRSAERSLEWLAKEKATLAEGNIDAVHI